MLHKPRHLASRPRGRSHLHRGDHKAVPGRAATAAALAGLALLIAAPVAGAQGDLPPGSGVDQYVESLPGAGGKKVPGTKDRSGADSARPQRPTPPARSRRPTSPEDRLLRRVAEDPELGAPDRVRAAPGAGSAREVPAAPIASRGSVLGAVGETFVGTGTGLPVLIGLLVIAGAGLTSAYRRRLPRESV